MLSRCIHHKTALCKLIDELGLEGPSEHDWSTAELLCHFMKPVTDYLQGEKYTTLGSLSHKLTQLVLYLSRSKPPQSWGLSRSSYCMQDFLPTDKQNDGTWVMFSWGWQQLLTQDTKAQSGRTITSSTPSKNSC